MCGLAGFCGSNPDFDKLKFLGVLNQSRGKDSSGVAFEFATMLKKAGLNGSGSFEEFVLASKFNDEEIKKLKRIFIHTRKATQGSVTKENAHPFKYELEDTSAIFMHNGNITNLVELKKKHDLKDPSPVDSKVLGEAIVNKKHKILKDYEGAAALAWMYENEDNTIYLWNGGSKTYAGKEYYERGIFYHLAKDAEGNNQFYFSSEEDHLKVVFGSEADIRMVPINTLVKVVNGRIATRKKYSRDDMIFNTTGLGSSYRKYTKAVKPISAWNAYDDYDDSILDYTHGFPQGGTLAGFNRSDNSFSKPKEAEKGFLPAFCFKNSSEPYTAISSIVKIKEGRWGWRVVYSGNFKFEKRRIFFDGTVYRIGNPNSTYCPVANGHYYFHPKTGEIIDSTKIVGKTSKEFAYGRFTKGFRISNAYGEQYALTQLNYSTAITPNEANAYVKGTYWSYFTNAFMKCLVPGSMVIETSSSGDQTIKISHPTYTETDFKKVLKELQAWYPNDENFLINHDLCPYYIVAKIEDESLKVVTSSYKEEYYDSLNKVDVSRQVDNLIGVLPLVDLDYFWQVREFIATGDSPENLQLEVTFDETSGENSSNTSGDNNDDDFCEDLLSAEESMYIYENALHIEGAVEDCLDALTVFANEFTGVLNSRRGGKFLTSLEKKINILSKFSDGMTRFIDSYSDEFLDTTLIDNVYENEDEDEDSEVESIDVSIEDGNETNIVLNL